MRAKLKIDEVVLFEHCQQLRFSAIGSEVFNKDGTSEDNTFARWTPTAELRMTITNPDLHNKFKPGQTFYVDFTEA